MSARCRAAPSRPRATRAGRARLGVRQPRRAHAARRDRRGRRAGRVVRRRRGGDRRRLDQRGRGLRPRPRSTCRATRTRWWRRCWRPIRAPSSCWSTARPTRCPGSTMCRRCSRRWLGGEAGPDAVARILLGEAEPSGRLPVTFPAALEDTPAHGFYPGGESVTYGEGLRVGYRHFDASQRAAAVPVRLRTDLHPLRLRRPGGARDGEGRRTSRGELHAEERRRAARQGDGAALCAAARTVGRPAGQGAEGLRQGRAGARRSPARCESTSTRGLSRSTTRTRREWVVEAGRLRPADRRFGGGHRAAGHCAAGRVTPERRYDEQEGGPAGSAHEI